MTTHTVETLPTSPGYQVSCSCHKSVSGLWDQATAKRIAYLHTSFPDRPMVTPPTVDTNRDALRYCYELAAQSPDPSTQNGAVLMDHGRLLAPTASCNEFPRGVEYTDERWVRPLKYAVIEHAERNAIFAAARAGIRTKGLTMVCAWAACPDCARAIIQSGITALVTHKQAADRSPIFWSEGIDIAMDMLREAKVDVVVVDGKVGGPPVRHSGEVWEP